MLRGIACGLLLCASAALAGCGDTATEPTPPPTPITETFTGEVNPAAGKTHSFITLVGGPIVATLTAVGPDATKNVGFSLGNFNSTLNVCTAVFDNPAALQSFEFKASASTFGEYCVRIYDNGNITTDAIPYTYTITVVHPQ
jgi:ABC-type oligopeptide transport system substrate-binding subunit